MRVRWILVALSLSMAACASMTPAERAARAEAEMRQMMQIYGPACDRLGYARDGDKWRDCVLQMSLQDEYRNSRRPVTTTCFGGRRGFLDCTTI